MSAGSNDPSPRPGVVLFLRAFRDGPGALVRLLNPLAAGAPLDLRIVGRTLLHAGLVGLIAGLVGAGFFATLEWGQRLLLEGLAGFEPLRAHGERITGSAQVPFRPWLLAVLPALGALASGLLTWWLASECAGGGGDAAIDAYHHGHPIRRRVAGVKWLASLLALSTGGSGGREGPTMQIGAAIGSAVGRMLPTRAAERRVLLVAGIAAGISAVFRTPLGAALLATEMMYRDDFEAGALVPSIFASVTAYAVVIALFGESTLFGRLPRAPISLRHLPLHVVAAVGVSFGALLFVWILRAVQRAASGSGLPVWLRPAVGGALMGALGTLVALWMASTHGEEARGFGVFGGGYGVLQTAMTGQAWLPSGYRLVGLLLAMAVMKMGASALTIGSGAAAGDFAPSMVIGGLLGAAFGHAARTALADPSIQPWAFTLVGMGTFYGGLAHAPLAALVLVAELAGSYDLLVPMMLAIGIAYVALRRHTLYPAQRLSRLAGAAPPGADSIASLSRLPVHDLLVPPELGPVEEHQSLEVLSRQASTARRQRVVVVTGSSGPKGLVELGTVLELPATERSWMRAGDATVPFTSVQPGATWGEVAAVLEHCGLSQVPVVDGGKVLGWVGERELRNAVLQQVEAGSPGGGAPPA